MAGALRCSTAHAGRAGLQRAARLPLATGIATAVGQEPTTGTVLVVLAREYRGNIFVTRTALGAGGPLTTWAKVTGILLPDWNAGCGKF